MTSKKNDRLPDITRMVVRLRDKGVCVYCGRRAAFRQGQVDHLTPRSWNGSDRLTNLAWSCRGCNGIKSGSDLAAFADMAFRHGYRPITDRFASPAEVVAAVTATVARPVDRAAARAALAAEQ